jgi:UDP-N-acetyl-D-glucosamine dehydrogenase
LVLERRSGLRAGRHFWLAYSPERIDPGIREFDLMDIPKVVGGVCRDSASLAAGLYTHLVPQVVTVSSPREAEMSKLIENTFRHVNIALANELAMISERLGIDFWEALEAASTKPFGFMPFQPGPGVGGHCVPIDPHYLAWKARECDMPLRLIDTLRGYLRSLDPILRRLGFAAVHLYPLLLVCLQKERRSPAGESAF